MVSARPASLCIGVFFCEVGGGVTTAVFRTFSQLCAPGGITSGGAPEIEPRPATCCMDFLRGFKFSSSSRITKVFFKGRGTFEDITGNAQEILLSSVLRDHSWWAQGTI